MTVLLPEKIANLAVHLGLASTLAGVTCECELWSKKGNTKSGQRGKVYFNCKYSHGAFFPIGGLSDLLTVGFCLFSFFVSLSESFAIRSRCLFRPGQFVLD